MRKVAEEIVASLAALLFVLGCACARPAAAQESGWVRETRRAGDFELVRAGHAADVYVSAEDFKVVRIAVDNLAADVERVTGARPAVRTDWPAPFSPFVYVGTLGHSPFIDWLARERKLDASELRGKWESFIIATVKNPQPGVPLGLVVVGSDRRGTAFGVYELA
ncbi:MAG: hypothetical protein ACJ74T_11480, partial [Pyrinomonadaceae bacterium]